MQRIVNLQLRQERNARAFFGPVAQSPARFEVHGEVRFVSDLHTRDTRAAAYYATARNVFHAAGHAVLIYRLNVLATRTLM